MSLVTCASPRRLATLAGLMVALAVIGTPAFAQGGGGGGGGGAGGGGARMQEALFKGITLSSAQQTKIDSIRAAYRASAGDASGGSEMSPDDRQKRRQAMRQQVTDMRAVLTPDQQPQYDQNVAAIRTQTRTRGGGRDSTPQ